MAFRSTMAFAALLLPASVSAAEQKFSLGNFEELVVEGDVIVNLDAGSAPAAKAEGAREKLGALRIDRQGKVVRIRSVGFQSTRQDKGPVTVSISGRDIRRIALIGSGRLSASAFEAENAKVELRGSGTIDLAGIKAFRLAVMISGSGTLKIGNGAVVNSEVVIDGGANFISAGLVSQNLKLVQSGPASTVLNVSNIAEITNSGSGSITIEGEGACLVRRAGSATLNCKKTAK